MIIWMADQIRYCASTITKMEDRDKTVLHCFQMKRYDSDHSFSLSSLTIFNGFAKELQMH
jgi:hypothetical protein